MAASGDRGTGAEARKEGESDIGLSDIALLTPPSICFQNPGNTAYHFPIQFQELENHINASCNPDINFKSPGHHQGQVNTQQTLSSCVPSLLSGQGLNKKTRIRCRTNMPGKSVAIAERKPSDKRNTSKKPCSEKQKALQEPLRAKAKRACEKETTGRAQPAGKPRFISKVQMLPYKERVIHLLALKAYTKPELLLQLQKDGILKKDKNSLGKILQQVATLNPKNFSYSLRDFFFQNIQRDWPGYSEADRQSLELILARRSEQSLKADVTNHPEPSRATDTVNTLQKQCLEPVFIDPLKKNKVRISHLTTGVQTTSCTQLEFFPGYKFQLLFLQHPQRVPRRLKSHMMTVSQHINILEHKEGRCSPLRVLCSISLQMKYPQTAEENHSTADDKLKFSCLELQANDQRFSIEAMVTPHADPARQARGAKLDSSKGFGRACISLEESFSASETSDYLTKYSTIISLEQRLQYAEAFQAENGEYQASRDKILTSSCPLLGLGTKIKVLSPDPDKFKNDGKEIILEYRKMKQGNSILKAEIKRCQYLYNKLSYIKRLIHGFDQDCGGT
ncbi:PREDICTED: RNA polymerase II elongation factor ELL2-like [Elephantulus edwardii]|uniref:RNA polymerase II elongation factor ELL2-like n=1 Tax=Elephantulus edwardii TaxID=28737 RepID=UPI0003F0CE82|nr:PREDICTED: RNA polymerase II elongation factor ELL2-like [Elephantulus edwardii]